MTTTTAVVISGQVVVQSKPHSGGPAAAQDTAACTGYSRSLRPSFALTRRRKCCLRARQRLVGALLADRGVSTKSGEETESTVMEQGMMRILEQGLSRDPAAERDTKPAMGLTDTALGSTLQHRVWTGIGSSAVMAALVKAGLAAAGIGGAGVAMAALGLGAGYVLADLGSGVYHWGIDNYGDAHSPVFGSQIDAFQGHHQRPWTITKRAFCNNSYAIARPVAFALAPFLLLPDSAGGDAFLASFLGCILLSQQIHAWAHSKKSQLPPLVVALQDKGVLVSRRMHGAHHRSPYDINYCIVSGLWNPLLNSSRAFLRMERAIFSWSGIRPRSWSDTTPQWMQETSYFEDGTHNDSH